MLTMSKVPLLPETDDSKTVQTQDAHSIYGGKFCAGKELPDEKLQLVTLKSCSLYNILKNSQQGTLIAEM